LAQRPGALASGGNLGLLAAGECAGRIDPMMALKQE
jgi:hypothetical protein